ncbi:hypothetical protein AVEN_55867-1 [Araneus ventricosus]|uniref:Uncharacterized protein n=1 Tax=Araneus ventricosus TaxID=182803 RepID=A0A4Y2GPR4_ARAVE|nr:hypothetical protein AVEN_55867-1 [Araneus ventricosus]
MTANKRSLHSRPITVPANQPAGDPSWPGESLPKCRVSGNYNGDKWRSEKRNYSGGGRRWGLTSQKSRCAPLLRLALPPTIIHGGGCFSSRYPVFDRIPLPSFS